MESVCKRDKYRCNISNYITIANSTEYNWNRTCSQINNSLQTMDVNIWKGA